VLGLLVLTAFTGSLSFCPPVSPEQPIAFTSLNASTRQLTHSPWLPIDAGAYFTAHPHSSWTTRGEHLPGSVHGFGSHCGSLRTGLLARLDPVTAFPATLLLANVNIFIHIILSTPMRGTKNTVFALAPSDFALCLFTTWHARLSSPRGRR
jgi:hypothetical protein